MSRWAIVFPSGRCPRDEVATSLSSSQFIIRKLQELQPGVRSQGGSQEAAGGRGGHSGDCDIRDYTVTTVELATNLRKDSCFTIME